MRKKRRVAFSSGSLWRIKPARLSFFLAPLALILGSEVRPFSLVDGARSAPTPAAVDPVARLQSRIDQVTIKLQFDDRFGYLPAVLEALHVPRSSQLLVLSKTSLQRDLIGPQTPRAIYFGDDVAVGFVLGSDHLEFAATDPKEGVYFYTLSQSQGSQPRFQNKIGCLNCHKVAATFNIQGLIVQSVLVDPSGQPKTAPLYTDHQTPFKDRWGGWYVTGSTGDQAHMGNSLARQDGPAQDPEAQNTRNPADLRGRIGATAGRSSYSSSL